MSGGRHGKMSGSPFHVQTIRELATEQYGAQYNVKKPTCNYLSITGNGVCELAQSEKNYNKQCRYFDCKYIKRINSRNRNSCSFADEKIGCRYSKKLSLCTSDNDLAFCCDYYLEKNKNPRLERIIINRNQIEKLLSKLKTNHKKSRKNRYEIRVSINKMSLGVITKAEKQIVIKKLKDIECYKNGVINYSFKKPLDLRKYEKVLASLYHLNKSNEMFSNIVNEHIVLRKDPIVWPKIILENNLIEESTAFLKELVAIMK